MSQKQNTKIIVTGAAGYIGGAICIELKKQGYYVIGVDRRYQNHLKPYYDEFIFDDFVSAASYYAIVEHLPKAVIHCAGTSLVGPSMTDPAEYYTNNVAKTARYLKILKEHSFATKFIFSSSASVYGSPDATFGVFEGTHINPISPYGQSKLMTEQMLDWHSKAYGMDYVSFRYFNACGAVANGVHGQEPDATHIFARLFDAGMQGKPFHLNGTLFNTKDGTCIRDYVHVTDIAKAHILAIEDNVKGIYNIGSNKGYSNLEIFTMVEKFLLDNKFIDKEIVVMVEPAREGDPAKLVANYDKLYNETGWLPELTINDIIQDLSDWYRSDNYAKKRSLDAHPS